MTSNTVEEDEDMFGGHEEVNETSLSQTSKASSFHFVGDQEEDNGISLSQVSEASSVHFVRDQEDISLTDDNKVFNDPVHGHISLHPLLVKIIDTPQFQRLRKVKQLGATYFVYPGASHNRFEHCIGTSHLAGKLTRMLQRNQPNLNITDEDILCVEMAGLCHDLGHGPFSHMFDSFLETVRPNSNWTHEKASCMMIDHLIDENGLWPEMEKYLIGQKDITFVKEMIAGDNLVQQVQNEWPFAGRGEDKSFLYEIVSNERNKVDVDKWDYFARDCHHLGIKNSFDHNRFMHFIRVQKVKGERLQICARDKECFNLYEMFHTRSVLHRKAYQHRVCKAIECMIRDAMILAEPYVKISGKNDKKLTISESIDDPVAYTRLDDGIFDRILNSTKKDLQPARNILNRILRRKLYRCVGVTKFTMKMETGAIPNQISKCDLTKVLKEEVLVASKRNVNYGMRDKNPIDSFKFFSKANPKKPYHVRKEEVSSMLPEVFEESELEVFCTDDTKFESACACFKVWCKNLQLEAKPASQDGVALTPMKRTVSRSREKADEKKKKIAV